MTKKIVIVGGGTAGWITALYLSRVSGSMLDQPPEITLVESSDIPTVGVGEATTPSLRFTLAAAGVDEYEFMRACDATFKHGIQFCNWTHAPSDDPTESYFHPFQHPFRLGVDHFAKHWQDMPVAERFSFSQMATIQQAMAETGLAPKSNAFPQYEGVVPYAYHLDAGKLATYLKQLAISSGVHHVISNVQEVITAEDGAVQELLLDEDQVLAGDFFFDCSGFRALLIDHDKQNNFNNKNDILFCDRAVVTRVPINSLNDIQPYTKSTAQQNGWVWDINLTDRRGVGHVYASTYQDDDQARVVLADYIGVAVDDLESRKLHMKIGYYDQQWRQNCVAIGLSAGFLEPLESTGIYLTEMAVWMACQLLPRYFSEREAASTFNAKMVHHFENIVDFIKAHYCLSKRTDSTFWTDNCNPETWSEELQELLSSWQLDGPNDYDFDKKIQCFSTENYQFVYYGMQPSAPPGLLSVNTSDPMVANLMKMRTQHLAAAKQNVQANVDFMTRLQVAEAVAIPAAAEGRLLTGGGTSYQLI